MDPKAILTEIRSSKPKISVVGETIEDHWYFGRAKDPSQENPDVWKFVAEKRVTMPGGAANVRSNLGVLTRTQIHHLTSEFITAKHRWWSLDSEKMDFRWDDDAEDKNPFWMERLNQCYENVVISDYGKGMMTWDRLERASDLLGPRKVIFSPHLRNCHDLPIWLNAAMRSWPWVMNYAEASEVGRRSRKAVRPATTFVTTRGSQSVLLTIGIKEECVPVEWSQMGSPLHAIGIGDAFLASLSAAYFVGIPMRESVQYAIWVCRKVLEARRLGTCCIQEGDLI